LNAALRDAAKAHAPLEQPGARLDGGLVGTPGFSVQLNCNLQVVPRAVAQVRVRRLRFLTRAAEVPLVGLRIPN
jgi:hypothetical protein